MLVGEAALFSLQVYGIAIVIALLAAVLIKVLVVVTGRLERGVAAKLVPQGAVCPVALGIPDEDVAALTAATYAGIGPYFILHISPTSRTWSSHGRAAQHTTHAVLQPPQH